MTISSALLTDLYQLTMAYGYWKLGRSEEVAVFHLFFRRPPFQGGYAVSAGVGPVLDFLESYRFDADEIEYLGSLTGNDGQPLFQHEFLRYLLDLQLSCDLEAVPEGTVVFGQEPLLRVTGPILQCQLLETPLLNIVNFQTLIATKAARICQAAEGEPVLEFGLRRAQGVDGGLAASRAAYVGGCAATSNVLAGMRFGIPVKGTHAHSWVMSFETEEEAFESYAQVLPNNCVFLVDTYDTLSGVRRAAEIGHRLRAQGHEMVGIRLDSGDLAYLSIAARRILDEAGFPEAVIVASNDLDEQIIESLKRQDSQISVWGVGTKLATAYDQPALGGVYKLGAMRDETGTWQPRLKISEQAIKTTIPGVLQVRRFRNAQGLLADMIYDQHTGIDPRGVIVDLKDPTRHKKIAPRSDAADLLIPVFRDGKRIHADEDLTVIRRRAAGELQQLHAGVRRFLNPHEHPVGLDIGLHQRRHEMIQTARLQTADAH